MNPLSCQAKLFLNIHLSCLPTQLILRISLLPLSLSGALLVTMHHYTPYPHTFLLSLALTCCNISNATQDNSRYNHHKSKTEQSNSHLKTSLSSFPLPPPLLKMIAPCCQINLYRCANTSEPYPVKSLGHWVSDIS